MLEPKVWKPEVSAVQRGTSVAIGRSYWPRSFDEHCEEDLRHDSSSDAPSGKPAFQWLYSRRKGWHKVYDLGTPETDLVVSVSGEEKDLSTGNGATLAQTKIQPPSLFGVPDSFQGKQSQSTLEGKTAAVSLSGSDLDEGCGGGTGVDPIPHSSQRRTSSNELVRVTSPRERGGTGIEPIPFRTVSSTCKTDQVTLLDGAALREAVINVLAAEMPLEVPLKAHDGLTVQQVLDRTQLGGVKVAGGLPAIYVIMERLRDEGVVFDGDSCDTFMFVGCG